MSRKRIREAAGSAQVDGDKNKKKMEGYKSIMTMDDMAIEWVEQVLSFLPLTDVYKCKSVCKEWQAAANYVISEWETLVLVIKDRRAIRPDKNEIFLQNEAEKWIKRLKQLVRLKRIFVTGNYFRPELLPVVDDVVLRNASTLTILHMISKPLPFDPKQPVVFLNLRDLDCSFIRDPDLVTACPRLVKLKTSTSPKVLQKLPAETLTSLHITFLELENGSHEEIKRLAAALSRLTRLKSLILIEGLRYFYGGDQWTELHNQALSLLFTNMKELKEVDITFPEHAVNVDAVIETLVHNSPSVSSIRMDNSKMRDASLHSLSRLTGLQHLTLRSLEVLSNITTEGILSLLRGGSRKCLQYLELSVALSPNLEQIRAEGQLMQQETGRSLSVIDGKKISERHHNFKIAIRG